MLSDGKAGADTGVGGGGGGIVVKGGLLKDAVALLPSALSYNGGSYEQRPAANLHLSLPLDHSD